ncbi:glycoside hydrolase family 18 protein [Gelatoporia subvermispora B]|uniref:chitinase n=1 Tax=Ceriporiopsis subvermispora (strain B) TaxID=914234 RepID=M2RB05_CERS8|nr:glycoside hydrolase family 18 protein [Gelatoporia subvermispora B]
MLAFSSLTSYVSSTLLLAVTLGAFRATAFDNTQFSNVAVYWGQDSYGATHTDAANFQQPIDFYCQDDAIDVFPVAFVDTFFGTGGDPVLDLANTCNATSNGYFSGTELLNCSYLAPAIEKCQAAGKIVTISLGGAGGGVGFQSDTQAQQLADTVWNLFLGGSSSTRPFGSAVLDGVDLDIEGGSNAGYAAFVTQLRTHFSGASKKYYVSGAPQCVYPDAYLGSALNTVSFDMVYVQFYNNPCGLQTYGTTNWNFGVWDIWARTISPNPDVKIYIGAPASSDAAGTGYQSISELSQIAAATRNVFPSFGGVMLWDASQAYANDRYDLNIKNALVAAGSTGFTFPACSADAWTSGGDYPGGSQVTYNSYIWQAKWYASSTPSINGDGDWAPISACSGTPPSGGGGSGSSSAPGSAPTGGAGCAGVAAWASSQVYVGGDQVSYKCVVRPRGGSVVC